ncbi:hypothetical protein HYU06_02215 [Candidatus Woesearchaeota archaeon]|nr:hypothetical protein [Candidatus Woesearchaeota archaeon]
MCKRLSGKDKEGAEKFRFDRLRKKCVTAMANILSSLYSNDEERWKKCKELVPDDYDDCIKGLDY